MTCIRCNQNRRWNGGVWCAKCIHHHCCSRLSRCNHTALNIDLSTKKGEEDGEWCTRVWGQGNWVFCTGGDGDKTFHHPPAWHHYKTTCSEKYRISS